MKLLSSIKKSANTSFNTNKFLLFVLPLIVIFTAFIVGIGWVNNIDYLKSVLENEVSMKFHTSSAFIMAGVFMFLFKKRFWLGMVLYYVTLTLPMLFPSIYEQLNMLVGDINLDKSIKAQTPSVATIIAFFSFGISAICIKFNHLKKAKFFEYVVNGLGAIALLGYLLKVPEMYFLIKHASGAMAFHTALLFLHLGLWLEIKRTNKLNIWEKQ